MGLFQFAVFIGATGTNAGVVIALSYDELPEGVLFPVEDQAGAGDH